MQTQRTLQRVFWRLLLFRAIFGFAAVLSGTEARGSDGKYAPTVIVDPGELSDQDRAAVIEALIMAQGTKAFVPIEVEKNQTLSEIIRDRYGYFSLGEHAQSISRISDAIARASGLRDVDAIAEKQRLAAPVLPLKPLTKGASTNLGQLIDLRSRALSLFDVAGGGTKTTVAVDTETFSALPTERSIRTGSTWHVAMDEAQRRIFMASLPAHIRAATNKYFVFDPGAALAEIKIATGRNVEEAAAQRRPDILKHDVKRAIAALTEEQVGRYYVLDFFSALEAKKTCTHGQLVLRAAYQTLHDLGADHLAKSIVAKELEFFRNRQQALEEMRRYVNSLPQAAKRKLSDELEQLSRKSDEQETETSRSVPLLFLQALYSNLLRERNTTLISSQFYITLDGYSIFPPEYTRDSVVPLLTAVLDDPGSIVEDTIYEPIKSFRDSRRDYGVALVGAISDRGAALGMTSKNGDGVTTSYLGRVINDDPSCGAATVWGTSFATPQVGVHLFIANGLWRANHETIAATEARIRLLLASELVPAFVNRYASGGVVSFGKLARSAGVYVVMADGTERVVNQADGKTVLRFRADPRELPEQALLKRQSGGFRGLQVVNGQVYVFWPDRLKWEVVYVDELSIPDIGNFTNEHEVITSIKEITLI